ncbi:mercury(II) reductase [Acidianus sp. RZ1]|uniref:mercury(II) reductase n=1 Tax=Acidianus sp. RZ1 TaxID=1540082 RepID=UPI001490BD5D|nr:mercury(II) reductase [Acidianus sp. RZ1]NON62482.1 mercury(II) reductase [Acidianus sp. RZ1]
MKLVIIGAGAAGFAAMIRSNQLGIRPVIINHGTVGGTCVNVGCVPSKFLLRRGEIIKYFEELGGKGKQSIIDAVKSKDFLVSSMRKEKYEDLLSYYDVDYVDGKAHFISPKAVKVNEKIIEGDRFIIATGSSPSIPEIPGLRESGFWTNVEALSPDRDIDSLIIVGGRAQALEFSEMYNRFGKEVAILQRSKVLIPDWEPEISLEIEKAFKEEGIYVGTGIEIKRVEKTNEGKKVYTNLGEVIADEILLATGRRPNVDLALENAGVSLNSRGGILVDQELRTTNPSIFAAGDVTRGPMLEALAGYEGSTAAQNAINNDGRKVDLTSVPQVIFTQPNLAKVGITEEEARKRGKTESRTLRMSDVAKAQILGEKKGLIKMVIDQTKKILGVHVMGENAAEFIGEAALVVKKGLTIEDIVDTIHVFPTVAESLRLVALSFYTDVKRLSCCV